MGIAIGRATGDKTAANVILGVYPKFALVGGIVRLLVEWAAPDHKVRTGTF